MTAQNSPSGLLNLYTDFYPDIMSQNPNELTFLNIKLVLFKNIHILPIDGLKSTKFRAFAHMYLLQLKE